MLSIFRKDFLLGIGLGFLLSALIVNFSGADKLTDSEIMERAAQLGMVHAEKETDKETDKVPGIPVKTPVNDAAKEPVKTEESNPPENTKFVKFVIRPGTGSEEISRMLEEQGVVTDRSQFYQLVTDKGAHRRFRTGTFDLPCDGDMEEILKILTGR
ncbi:hypothetical protein [Phosphitispora fastidiosa]|uniref:hypothetical protein n=1 Tax=Phosphitispora fastidiosa TaxID=2837202 RepID=UPI001E489E28|nr:hypothetical protein [Phosphitispora fastidiosa]MBU7008298.1 hypothetical protein [Phosphitispora fastidiosa]